MSDIAISVRGVSKDYVIGGRPLAGRTFREAMTDHLMKPFKALSSRRDDTPEERFWALRDVSFDIRQGEVVGIIGRNGAGKSTLLKVLSQITAPSSGRVEIRGRIASLLEVGTGFHSELTGRENVRLNGAILGMSQREIRMKFDEIVAFAGIEKFIDTPVKRYSSGMQVRLAFAVAAHLDPEILLVDEVLAVGDAEFQKRCLGKMQEITGQGGRTVVFVSHNLAATRGLCPRSILLTSGRLAEDGETGAVIAHYLGSLTAGGDHHSAFTAPPRSGPGPKLLSAAIPDAPAHEDGRSLLKLWLEIDSDRDMPVNVDLRIRDMFGNPAIYATLGALDRESRAALREGRNGLGFQVDLSALAVGRYSVSIDLSKPFVQYFDRHEDCLAFEIDHLCWTGKSAALEQAWNNGNIYLPLEPVEVAPSAAIAQVEQA